MMTPIKSGATGGAEIKQRESNMSIYSCNKQLENISDRPLEGEEKGLVDAILSSIIRPDAVVELIVFGAKFIAVTADGRMGISALLGATPQEHEMDLVHQMVGKSVKEVAGLIHKPFPFSIALGLAAVNAGNTPDPNHVEPNNFPADDLIARLGKTKITGLVGEFPFVDSLRKRVGTFHLFELKSVPGAVPRDQWERVLAELDIFALTATTLLTRSMAWFMSRAPQAKIIILGPTTPFSPVLYRYGADYLCGSVVTDTVKVAQGVRSGLPFKMIKRNGGIIFTQWEKTDWKGKI